MVYRYISPDTKQRALCLIEKGWTSEDIVGVSSKSITRWEDNYEQHGRVESRALHRTVYGDGRTKYIRIYNDSKCSG
jgi:hypothetical protein